jgi:DNA-binding NarL/FixJ family response regulator
MGVTPGERARRRVLLVADDPHLIDELRRLLARPHFECEVALDVETAWRILNTRRMDAVVLDAMLEDLPEAGEGPLIRQIKEADPEVKLVVCKGACRKPLQRRMRRLGADGYVSRNSDPKAVVRSVERVIGADS